MNTKKFTQITLALVLAITIVTGVRLVLAASNGIWNSPTGTPPTNNVAGPINVGSSDQQKSGGLYLVQTVGGQSGKAIDYATKIDTSGIRTGVTSTDSAGVNSYANLLTSSGIHTKAFAADANSSFSQALTVGGTVTVGNITTSGANADSGITLSSSGTARHYSVYNGSTNGDFRIKDNYAGTDRLTITNTGALAVGSTSVGTGLMLGVNGKVGATAYCDTNGNNCIGTTDITSHVTLIYDNVAHSFLPSPTTNIQFFGSICKVFVNGYVSNNATHIMGEYTIVTTAPSDYDHSVYYSPGSVYIKALIDAGSVITLTNGTVPTIKVNGTTPALEVKTVCY